MNLILLRQILARLAATPATLTASQAAQDLKANYAPLARQVTDRIGLLEKDAAALDAEVAAEAARLVEAPQIDAWLNTTAGQAVRNTDYATMRAAWVAAGAP